MLCGVVALLLCSACTKEEGQGNLLSVNYSFKWERAYWDIRNGVIGQAFYNGPKLGVAWDLSINRTSGKSILFATVHRAAMKFYYGNCLGVHRPVLADSKTKIAVKDENASWAEAVAMNSQNNTILKSGILYLLDSILLTTEVNKVGILEVLTENQVAIIQ